MNAEKYIDLVNENLKVVLKMGFDKYFIYQQDNDLK